MHRSGAEAALERAGRVEPRTRAECYEALRAADGESGRADGGPSPADDDHRQSVPRTGHHADRQTDSGTGRSGWDAVDAEHAGDRPAPEGIGVTPERRTHILDGDSTGGGHRHGTGKPGKTEFPPDWDDDKIIDTALSVARKPDRRPVHQDRNNRWLCTGTRDSVEMSVIVLPGGGVWTAWPEEASPGVVRNPRKGKS